MKKYSYDLNMYYFDLVVKKIFHIDDLQYIHTILDKQLDIPDDPSKDQTTVFHKIFYANYDDDRYGFLPLYTNFVRYLTRSYFPNQDMVYQTKPTFRVQAPENIAVAQWHKDKAYNHSFNEINIYLPLTNAFDTNTIWSESEEDKGDYSPMEANLGEFYIWNGANLTHGNKKNETGVSRVSIDFRLISLDKFEYSGTSVTSKVPMELGKYWSKL